MEKPSDPLDFLSHYVLQVEEELREILKAEVASDGFFNLLHYHLGWVDSDFRPVKAYGGKRIRPVLCLLVCEALGGEVARALPAAAAIELIHNFSLAHDDVEDRSPIRRGRETLWKLWGNDLAINSGDALLALAHLAMQRLAGHHVPDSLITQCLGIMDAACLSLAQGQYLDLVFAEQEETTVEMYLDMAGKKTARLLETSANLGALLANAREEDIAGFRNFARVLGMGFQVSDDLSGIWGDPQVIAKGVGEDIRHKKKSLPVVYALQEERRRGEAVLSKIYSQPTLEEGHVRMVKSRLEETGARGFAAKMVGEFQAQALDQLDALEIQNSAVKKLKKLTLLVLENQH